MSEHQSVPSCSVHLGIDDGNSGKIPEELSLTGPHDGCCATRNASFPVDGAVAGLHRNTPYLISAFLKSESRSNDSLKVVEQIKRGRGQVQVELRRECRITDAALKKQEVTGERVQAGASQSRRGRSEG